MKLDQTSLQKIFSVKYKGKYYYVDYLNSDDQILGLLNRDYWVVIGENGEEVNIYEFQSGSKRERIHIKNNRILVKKLINFCIKHFNDYKPDI